MMLNPIPLVDKVAPVEEEMEEGKEGVKQLSDGALRAFVTPRAPLSRPRFSIERGL